MTGAGRSGDAPAPGWQRAGRELGKPPFRAYERWQLGERNGDRSPEEHGMPWMAWSDRLGVGVRRFDDAHKQMLELVNELFDAGTAGKGKEQIAATLQQLIDRTKLHFSDEEAAMKATGFLGLPAHRLEHQTLLRQVSTLQRQYQDGASSHLSPDVLKFLGHWLEDHLQGVDKKYTAWLNARGYR
jgi:hemerythrin